MPQPTFHFKMTEEEGAEAHEMMADMCKAATALGGYLPGSEPSFQQPGLALHITVGHIISGTKFGIMIIIVGKGGPVSVFFLDQLFHLCTINFASCYHHGEICLPLQGTCRMGKEHDGSSVVDTFSRVWAYDNLFLGTCGVIPSGTACNPTNTAMALAIRSANYIVDNFKGGKFNN